MVAEDDPLPTAESPVKEATRKRRKRSKRKRGSKPGGPAAARGRAPLAFPKHAISKCLRIPQAILEQNAGKECTYREASKFAGIGYTGDIGVEISSALKYGLLERVGTGLIRPTDLTRRVVRPQKSNDKRDALREGVLSAPVLSDAYKHYRGENLPDDLAFLGNTARDTFNVPAERVNDFVSVFIECLTDADLLEEVAGKKRVVDITHTPAESQGKALLISTDEHLKKVAKGVSVDASETCFVMMPFADPIGAYFGTLYGPAIKRAGMTAVRADTDIFGTGKIIDQIWAGISNARVLVAELTGRNPNVLYELGLAHALKKPVVLVSSNENDVPFDVRHVRVIYYQMSDPFWGEKLIAKVAENILSALRNPGRPYCSPRSRPRVRSRPFSRNEGNVHGRRSVTRCTHAVHDVPHHCVRHADNRVHRRECLQETESLATEMGGRVFPGRRRLRGYHRSQCG
jgi:hypothetical protein